MSCKVIVKTAKHRRTLTGKRDLRLPFADSNALVNELPKRFWSSGTMKALLCTRSMTVRPLKFCGQRNESVLVGIQFLIGPKRVTKAHLTDPERRSGPVLDAL
jgi:hypothetical protein